MTMALRGRRSKRPGAGIGVEKAARAPGKKKCLSCSEVGLRWKRRNDQGRSSNTMGRDMGEKTMSIGKKHIVRKRHKVIETELRRRGREEGQRKRK